MNIIKELARYEQQKSNYLFAAGFFNFTPGNGAKADEQYPGRMKYMLRLVEE
tara:strand:+ start:359 stop:514 length:156 start_codon:yes stop_codon:yes gene_type:complete